MAKKKKEEAPAKKPAEGLAPSRSERIAALKDFVNKKMKGRAQLKLASEYVLPFMTKRCPTGLLSLDVELKGGFPCGGLSQIVGAKNAGKTYLAWQVIRQQQFYKGDDLRVLLAMTEMRADRSQARKAGVKIALGDEDIESENRARKNAGVPELTKEEIEDLRTEIGQIDELHGEDAESLYDVIIKAIEENMYHVIIIDSFGSIMSGAENEAESLQDKTYGGAAGVNTRFLKKLSSLLTMDNEFGEARDVCIIGINQVRDAIGQPNLDYKSTGGRMLEHFKFVDLLVQSGKKVGYEDKFFSTEGSKTVWTQTGKEVNWRIEKGKAGIHEGAKGSYLFDFAAGTGNFYLDTLVAGVRHGVIEQSGNWLGIPNPNEAGKFLVREMGRDNFVQALIDDATKKAEEGNPDTLMNHIRSEVFKKNEIYINYDW
jgi:RecA/RadA recombinase